MKVNSPEQLPAVLLERRKRWFEKHVGTTRLKELASQLLEHYLLAADNADGTCTWGATTLARKLGMNKGSVCRSDGELIELGLIKVNRQPDPSRYPGAHRVVTLVGYADCWLDNEAASDASDRVEGDLRHCRATQTPTLTPTPTPAQTHAPTPTPTQTLAPEAASTDVFRPAMSAQAQAAASVDVAVAADLLQKLGVWPRWLCESLAAKGGERVRQVIEWGAHEQRRDPEKHNRCGFVRWALERNVPVPEWVTALKRKDEAKERCQRSAEEKRARTRAEESRIHGEQQRNEDIVQSLSDAEFSHWASVIEAVYIKSGNDIVTRSIRANRTRTNRVLVSLIAAKLQQASAEHGHRHEPDGQQGSTDPSQSANVGSVGQGAAGVPLAA